MRLIHRGLAGLAGLSFSLAAQAVAPQMDPQATELPAPPAQAAPEAAPDAAPTPQEIAPQDTAPSVPPAPPAADTGPTHASAPADEPLGTGLVKVTLTGFLKLDSLFSVFSDGRVSSRDEGRDAFRPNAIPVTAGKDPRSMFDMHAKDSRLGIKVDTEVSGHALGGLVEMDYRTFTSGATEVVTNGFTPRLRRAFVTYDEWTLGQDWTTFRNPDAIPDVIDALDGPVEALNPVRQSLLRYKTGGLAVALENSETFLQPNVGGLNTTPFFTNNSLFPDLVARYDQKADFGTVGVAVVARELRAKTAPTGGSAPFNVANGNTFAWGATVAGKAKSFAGAEARFGFTCGDGVGRYLANGTFADASVAANGDIETIKAGGAYVDYRQPWNAQWRSNFVLGALRIRNDSALTGLLVTKNVDSAHVNLLYQAEAKLLFGLEYTHAIRTLEDDDKGSLDRVQFSTKYSF